MCRIITLFFSNGEKLEIVTEHGLFSVDSNEYVYISEKNIHEYLGCNFYAIENNGSTFTKNIIKLVNYEITEKEIRVFSPVTKTHLNCFANNILTISSLPFGLTGIVNMFELNEDMSYNIELMEKDLTTYGEYTYEDVKDYVSYEVYINSPIKYFKVSVGKGLMTEEEFYYLLEYYKLNN